MQNLISSVQRISHCLSWRIWFRVLPSLRLGVYPAAATVAAAASVDRELPNAPISLS